jgi:predicted DNA-binding protein with PD1-like motif
VSLVGTLSMDGAHIHVAIADATGAVTGGHLLAGSIVRTTAELVLGDVDDVRFHRPIDPETTYDELVIEPRDA